MLKMEQNGSEDLSENNRKPHVQGWDSHQRKNPSEDHDRHQLLQKGQAEDPIPFWYSKSQSYKPHQRRGKEKEDNWFSQNPSSNLLDALHLIVLFLGKEYGLREIQSIQVPKMLVMVVMSIPPRVEREMGVHAYQFPKEDVHLDGLEEGEVGHVMKLYEESNIVECVDGPAHYAESEMDQRDCQNFIGEGHSNSHHGLTVIGTTIRLHVLFYLRDLLGFLIHL